MQHPLAFHCVTRRIVGWLLYLAISASAANAASEWYSIDVVARTGQEVTYSNGGSVTETLSGLSSVSINSSGTTTFLGATASGSAIYARSYPLSAPIQLRTLPPSTTRLVRTFQQINDNDVIIGLDRSSNTEFLRTWTMLGGMPSQTVIVRGNLNPLTGAATDPYFENLLVAPSISNSGLILFHADLGRKGGLPISCPQRCLAVPNPSVTASQFATLPLVGQPLMRPMLADNGFAVFRNGATSTSPTVLLNTNVAQGQVSLPSPVNISPGFLITGQQPGISDDGAAVAFAGSRGLGDGIFLHLPNQTDFEVIRVAGEGAGDFGLVIGADRQTIERQVSFASVSLDTRVGVIHEEIGGDGLLNDSFTVVFLGTPDVLPIDTAYYSGTAGVTLRSTLGLFSRRIDIRRAPADKGGRLETVLGPVVPVLQVGDEIPGVPGSQVTGFGVSDPISRVANQPAATDPYLAAGAHRIGFTASATVNGSSQNFVLRGTRAASVLLNVNKLSQGRPWARPSPTQFDATAQYDSHPHCTLGRKGCWVTTMSMQHNYVVQRYLGDLATTFLTTPPRSNSIFVTRGRFINGSLAPDGTRLYLNAQACFAPGNPTTDVAPDLSNGSYPTLAEATVGQNSGFWFTEVGAPRTGAVPTMTPTLTMPATSSAVHSYILDTLTRSSVPVALKVINAVNTAHYLLAVGIEGPRIVVADPGCSARTYLDEVTASCGVLSHYQRVGARGAVVDPLDLSQLTVSAGSEVLITDSAGRRLGSEAGVVYREIPGGTVIMDEFSDAETGEASPPLWSVTLPNPPAEIFQLRVFGSNRTTEAKVDVIASNGTTAATADVVSSANSGPQDYRISVGSNGGAGSIIEPENVSAVPNVVGLTQGAALGALTNAGFTLGDVTQQSSATVPAGSVISQDPVAGANAAPGTAVSLVVSSGPANVLVPSVVTLAQSSAIAAITDAGLVVGAITQQSSASVPMNHVISQNPGGGSSVAAGSAVNLVISSGPQMVSVPNLIGLSQSAASDAITNVGLVVGVVVLEPSASAPVGTVIGQAPSGGVNVNLGSAVNLTVSSGPATVAVPSVTGLTQSSAVAAITNAGLLLGTVTTQSSASVAAGHVIAQDPPGGASAAAGSLINLVVSSGPALVTVPSVLGLTQSAATTSIVTAGLTVGTITSQHSASVPVGGVVSQNPPGGASVTVGTTVNLVISSGPALVAVPNVVGLSQSAAASAITNAGLTLGTVTQEPSTTVPVGTVIRQSPAAGTNLATGSAVTMVVSTGAPAAVACDVNSDGRIDRNDIALITAARNQPANGSQDPRDPDRNGVIDVLDARQCTAACTSAQCALP